MAKSQYEYVKSYEIEDRLLPGCWIVIRLDGRGFTKCAAPPALGTKIIAMLSGFVTHTVSTNPTTCAASA